jgi:general secretion pathway protein E
LPQEKPHLPKNLLDALKSNGILDLEQISRVQNASRATGTNIVKAVLELGLVDEQALYEFLASYVGYELVDPPDFDLAMISGLPVEAGFWARAGVLPVRQDEHGMTVATSQLDADDTLASIEFRFGLSVRPVLATPTTVSAVVSLLDGAAQLDADTTSEADLARLNALANDGPIIKLINRILAHAVHKQASDIHVETQEFGGNIRLRVDGALQQAESLSSKECAAAISRVKIMSGLNISEKNTPQDGRARVMVQGAPIDLRISCLPTQFGESVVLRILDRRNVALTWDALGYSRSRAAEIERIVNLPNGLFLVAGPTGSGKTTTLYTALSRISSGARKIITVEDPIEYSLPGVSQVHVKAERGMGFSGALRAILRQDPDVILVGEIRDEETAEIAVRAALVGRMVLSTIHTNDSIAAIYRLLDLGVPSYLLAATLRGVLSQRLVQVPCKLCVGQGCQECDETGLKGRSVVSELLEWGSYIEPLLKVGATRDNLQAKAEEHGFQPMRTVTSPRSPVV